MVECVGKKTYYEIQKQIYEGLKNIKGHYMTLSEIENYLELKGYIDKPKTEEDKVENSSILAEMIDYQADCGKVKYISINKGDEIYGLFTPYEKAKKNINGFSFNFNFDSTEDERLKANEFLELFESHLAVCEIKSYNIYDLLDYLKEQSEMGIKNITDKTENIIVNGNVGVSESIQNYIDREIYEGKFKTDETGVRSIEINLKLAWLNLKNNRKISSDMSKLVSGFQMYQNVKNKTFLKPQNPVLELKK